MAAAREAKLKQSPMSIFVSLKTQKLYVRQGTEPVLEMRVTIRDPDKPIGTHNSLPWIMPKAGAISVGPLYPLAKRRSPMNRQA